MGATWRHLLLWQLSIILSVIVSFSAGLEIILDAPDVTLRLQDGSTNSRGRLEIEYYITYSDSATYRRIGTICDHNFHLEEASVACRQLGYQSAEERTTPYFTSDSYFGIILQEVNCNGNEDKLTDCYYVLNEGLSTCNRSNDVGVACTYKQPTETPRDISPGDLRLAGGPNPYEGRVEVFLAETEEWATFCSKYWDFRKAELACKKLGYRPATSTGTMRYGAGTGSIVNCSSTDNNLRTTECQILSGTDPTCSHDMDVDIVCTGSESGRQGQVRLVDGATETEGRVEFFDQNTWKTPCSDNWGIEEVQATCRQLGLVEPSSARPPPGGSFGRSEAGAILQSSITCTGQEVTLQNCTWTTRTIPCTTGDANAQCGIRQAAKEFDLRLDGGLSGRLEGYLEIFYQGEWGAVCDSNFGMEEATVACRQLGFQFVVRKKEISHAQRDYFLNKVNCNGNEENLVDCYHIIFIDWACDVRDGVGLVCSNLPVTTGRPDLLIGDLRLTGGPNLYEGQVEVFISEAIGWATVCQENIDFSWAETACQILGYRPATSVSSGRYDGRDVPIARCPALTSRLDTENCQPINDSDPICNRSTNVEIVCSGFEKGRQGQVRLINGSVEIEGRVEFFDQNTWKTLCSDDWGIEEVQATCRQLGLPPSSSAEPPPGGSFGSNEAGENLQNSITCTGQKLTLQNCSWTPRSTPCTTGDASAQCGMRQAAEEFDLRLADGSTITEGRVEMLYQGQWGTVCNRNVKDVEATVICNQLGFRYAEGTKSFGPGNGKILVEDLNCNGDEESLLECYHKFDHAGCVHTTDLGVICSNLPQLVTEKAPISGDLRLAGGPNLYEGRVEVYISEAIGWATVCQDNVDFSWGEQACQKLGYRPATSVGTTRYGLGNGPIVVCPGANQGLDTKNCQLVNQTDPTVSCNHTRDIDVVCNGIEVGDFGDIRLQNGIEPTEGSVEIFYDNVWQRVCADDWGIEEAKTACYQLGMPVPNNTVPGGTFAGNTNRTFFPKKFQCNDVRERRLFGCYHSSRTTPCGTSDAGLQCGIWKDAKEGDLRMSGGPVNSIGRVEVFHAGQWGLVCTGPSYMFREEFVICQQLGFLSYESPYPLVISYDLPDLPVLLRLTECTGYEDSLLDCADELSIDSSPCATYLHFDVECDPRPRVDTFGVRLVNGAYPNQGIVQVLYNGREGAICNHLWGEDEALVVCRQLGYESVVVPLLGSDVWKLYGFSSEVFNIFEVHCEGSETNLADCFYAAPKPSVGTCFDSGAKAGVVCYSDEYPSIDPRPPFGDVPANTTTRDIAIGVSIGVVALIFLFWGCSRLKKNSQTPAVLASTTEQNTGVWNPSQQHQPDIPPQYRDVTKSPDLYPVVAAGPQENGQEPDQSNSVEDTAM